MNGTETKEALAQIALRKAAPYADKLADLDKSAKMERKALMIAKRAAENCSTFTNIEFMGKFYEVRERRVFGQNLPYFEEYRAIYNNLEGDDRESFLVFSFAITMVKSCLYDKRKEKLEHAALCGDCEREFESKIMCGIMEDVLKEWQIWWNENGCVPCEVIK